MPISPSPGKGLSTAGLDKTTGWGSRTGTGELILGHEADQGIDHLSGLSEGGMDTSTAPFVRTLASTGIAGTTCTVNWSTAPSSPAGSIRFRLAGSVGGAYTTVAESAGNKTAHAIPLTGLTAAKTYEYTITQPSPVAGVNGVAVEFSGRFHTTGGTMLLDAGNTKVPPAFRNGPGEPVAPALGGPASSSSSTPAFELTDLRLAEIGPDEAVIEWRTSVYADGALMYRSGENEPVTVEEPGVKRRNHSILLTGLAPAVVYEVAVISADAEGRTVEAGPLVVETTED